jgi:hypothetical protein
MSETAMRRLRSVNPVAQLPAPRPIETVIPGWSELDRGARGSGADDRGRLRGLGVVLSVVGVAVTLAVVIVFTSLSGHRQTPSHPSPLRHPPSSPRTLHAPLGSVPTLQQLLDNFAILGGRGGGNPFAPGQKNRTVVAREFPGGYQVYVYVRRFGVSSQFNLATNYAVTFGIVDAHGNSTVSDFGPNVNYDVEPLPWGGARAVHSAHPGQKMLWASLVPDGVATVTWKFGCSSAPHVNPRVCAGIRTQTVTMRVINNVAASEIADVGRAGGPTVTWRASNGTVVGPSFGGYGNFAAPPFVKGEREGRELPVLLPNGIGRARIGERSSSAIQTIERLLGAPAQVNARTAACGIDHETVWASPTSANLLTIFERAGRFVGYRYGAPVDEIGLIQGPGAVLTTENGLTLDDTVAVGKQLYASGFSTSAANGNTWRVESNGGSLSGSVLPTTYPVRGITPGDRIANIAAGETGCAASAN